MSSHCCHSNDPERNLCREFARILEGDGTVTPEGVCLVQKFRNIRFTILGVEQDPHS